MGDKCLRLWCSSLTAESHPDYQAHHKGGERSKAEEQRTGSVLRGERRSPGRHEATGLGKGHRSEQRGRCPAGSHSGDINQAPYTRGSTKGQPGARIRGGQTARTG